jgi:hypothetical protein
MDDAARWRRKDEMRRDYGFSYSKIDRWVRSGRIERQEWPGDDGRLYPHFRLAHHLDAPHAPDAVRDALTTALLRLETLETEHAILRDRIAALEAAPQQRAALDDASPDDADDAPQDADAPGLVHWWRQWSWRR